MTCAVWNPLQSLEALVDWYLWNYSVLWQNNKVFQTLATFLPFTILKDGEKPSTQTHLDEKVLFLLQLSFLKM